MTIKIEPPKELSKDFPIGSKVQCCLFDEFPDIMTVVGYKKLKPNNQWTIELESRFSIDPYCIYPENLIFHSASAA